MKQDFKISNSEATLVEINTDEYPQDLGSSHEPDVAMRIADTQFPRPWLLAVSGGADSMVMLHAASRLPDLSGIAVATFDHGTGPAATRAAALVEQTARNLGFPVFTGKASKPGTTEAEWRSARLGFLRETADRMGNSPLIAIAHTMDDQIETVFMRILRDSGPRGLSGLFAPGNAIIRPLLSVSREKVLNYADRHGVQYVTDPSNVSRVHFRNRIRHDHLPAIRSVQPDFDRYLLDLSKRASKIRAQIERIAASFIVMSDSTGAVSIPADQFSSFQLEELRLLWPAILARIGIVMDRRGTHRLAAFTIECQPGKCIQLSGRVEVRRRRNAFVFTRQKLSKF